jgi:hypothetical protein
MNKGFRQWFMMMLSVLILQGMSGIALGDLAVHESACGFFARGNIGGSGYWYYSGVSTETGVGPVVWQNGTGYDYRDWFRFALPAGYTPDNITKVTIQLTAVWDLWVGYDVGLIYSQCQDGIEAYPDGTDATVHPAYRPTANYTDYLLAAGGFLSTTPKTFTLDVTNDIKAAYQRGDSWAWFTIYSRTQSPDAGHTGWQSRWGTRFNSDPNCQAKLIFNALTEKPVFTPGSKYFAGPTAITITAPTTGSTIHYTTNGDIPTASSTLYTGPVTVYNGTTLKAVAVGADTSDVTSQTYAYHQSTLTSPIVLQESDCGFFARGNIGGSNYYWYWGQSTESGVGPVIWQDGIGYDYRDWFRFALPTGYTADSLQNVSIQLTAVWDLWVGYDVGLIYSQTQESLDSYPAGSYADVHPGYRPTEKYTDYLLAAGGFLSSTPQTFTIDVANDIKAAYQRGDSWAWFTIYSRTQSPDASHNGWQSRWGSRFNSDPNCQAKLILNYVADPVFSPSVSDITGPTAITITTATSDASIYYTTNGSTPTTSSTLYTGPIIVSHDGTVLKAIAIGYSTYSNVVSRAYTYRVPAPTFTPGGHYISGPTAIKISTTLEGASIYYTTNGTTPATSSTLYTGPIVVKDGDILQAIAVASGYSQSNVTSLAFEVPGSYSSPAAIPFGKATVDGNISDWSDATWTAMNSYPNIGTSQADIDADVPEAYFAAKWQKNKVYVAVKVHDMSHYFTNTYTAWNARDAIEVFIHTDNDGGADYSPFNTDAQQYEVGIKTDGSSVWSTVGSTAFNLSSWATAAVATGKVDGDWLIYELEITPYTYFGLVKTGDLSNSVVSNLFATQVIGLDVDVISNNSIGTFLGKKSASSEENKWKDWLCLGLHKLAGISGDANGDGMVDVGDLGILAANYGMTSGAIWGKGDFNGDGAVDVGDLGILAANYGTGTSGADFNTDYAKAFGSTTTSDADVASEDIGSSLCSGLGLPLIAGLLFTGLTLRKQDE